MNTVQFFALIGVSLVCIALHGLIVHAHLIRKILALNVMSSGVFLFLVALALKSGMDKPPDPICHAMVLTGVVVAVSATALALCLFIKFNQATGSCTLTNELR